MKRILNDQINILLLLRGNLEIPNVNVLAKVEGLFLVCVCWKCTGLHCNVIVCMMMLLARESTA